MKVKLIVFPFPSLAAMITSASTAATAALGNNSNMDMAIPPGYENLQHVDTSQHQQLTGSGSISSYASSAVSVSISTSNSSSSATSVPLASGSSDIQMSKKDIYQHSQHDWNFGVKMELSNQQSGEVSGEMNAGDEQQLQMDNFNNGGGVNMLDNNDVMRNADGIYHNTIYETSTQEVSGLIRSTANAANLLTSIEKLS